MGDFTVWKNISVGSRGERGDDIVSSTGRRLNAI